MSVLNQEALIARLQNIYKEFSLEVVAWTVVAEDGVISFMIFIKSQFVIRVQGKVEPHFIVLYFYQIVNSLEALYSHWDQCAQEKSPHSIWLHFF